MPKHLEKSILPCGHTVEVQPDGGEGSCKCYIPDDFEKCGPHCIAEPPLTATWGNREHEDCPPYPEL